MKRISLIALGLIVAACGNDTPDALEGVNSITFLQRTARGGVGDVFQFDSYLPGGRIVQLSPPTADGELTVVCCEQFPEFATADISYYDVSFDAREIVFSAKLTEDRSSRYGLFVYSVESDNYEQLPTDPNFDYVTPIFLPGNKIMFMTTAVVEPGQPQFVDEYERGITTQIGIINRDGTEEELGARNLSHRVTPSLLSDGRVMLTEWRHVAEVNEGLLMVANPDMTAFREAYGNEGSGVTEAYIKAREISPGRVVAIATARDRTIQAGTLLDVRLGEVYEEDGNILADRNMSEANASYRILTPQVPLRNAPSSATVGRYHDAEPLNARDFPDLLVSWADGTVESGTLFAADLPADFGIYLYDSAKGARRPIWNDTAYWDVLPRVFAPRDAPPVIEASGRHQFGTNTVLLSALDVYDSTQMEFEPGSIYGVRVIEGYSSETPGIPRDFGLTEHEGAAMLGIAEVRADGSYAGLIPANIPVRQQAIDKYGMALLSEEVWVSGRPGEPLACGGCHNDRARTTIIDPGITDAIAIGPDNLRSGLSRTDRQSLNDSYTMDDIVGVPWNLAVQPILDANCVGCHDGTPRPDGANPCWTLTDTETGETSQEWCFDLTEGEIDFQFGDTMISGYSKSYLTLLGPDMIGLQEGGAEVVVNGTARYVTPGSARSSQLIEILNPPELYPTPDLTTKAFPGTRHGDEKGFQLTADEYHVLILMAEMGGQFYSRENAVDEDDLDD